MDPFRWMDQCMIFRAIKNTGKVRPLNQVKTGHLQLNEQKSKFDLKTKIYDNLFDLKAENFDPNNQKTKIWTNSILKNQICNKLLK